MRRIFALSAPALVLASALLATGCASTAATSVSPPPDPKSVYRVNAPLLNLLSCPNVDCDVTEDLRNGQEVAVLSPNMNGWVMVRVLPSGREGYVLAKHLIR